MNLSKFNKNVERAVCLSIPVTNRLSSNKTDANIYIIRILQFFAKMESKAVTGWSKFNQKAVRAENRYRIKLGTTCILIAYRKIIQTQISTIFVLKKILNGRSTQTFRACFFFLLKLILWKRLCFVYLLLL